MRNQNLLRRLKSGREQSSLRPFSGSIWSSATTKLQDEEHVLCHVLGNTGRLYSFRCAHEARSPRRNPCQCQRSVDTCRRGDCWSRRELRAHIFVLQPWIPLLLDLLVPPRQVPSPMLHVRQMQELKVLHLHWTPLSYVKRGKSVRSGYSWTE